ncbi:hypothetical protein C5O27_02655 [Gordonia alkanivorans]|nr:hypothetical protein C5O27_02655 [Gordonia alkanivorans]
MDPSVWRLALIAVLGACAAACGYLLGGSHRSRHAVSATAHSPTVASDAQDGESARLVHALIGAYDTSSEESVRLFITQELNRNGVDYVGIAPDSRFDSETARCVATEPAPTAELDGRVAHTDRPGWRRRDGTTVYRNADVTVWKASR